MSWRCVRRGLPGPAARCVSSSSALPPDLILILANDPDSTRHNHAAATRQLLAAPPIPYLNISKDIISESSTVPKVRVPGHVTMGHKIELEWGEITYFPQYLLGAQGMTLHHHLSKVHESWSLQPCSEYKTPDCPYVHICTMIVFIYVW